MGHLNATGLARAQYVAGLWDGTSFPVPKAIFANLFNDEFNSVELVEPLAHRFGLPVNTSYNRRDNWQAAGAILHALQDKGSPILVAWEHKHIVRLLVDMGCARPWLADWWSRLWPRSDFDEIFVADFSDGACVALRREREGFVAPKAPGYAAVVAWALALIEIIVLAIALAWRRDSSGAASGDAPASSFHEAFLGASLKTDRTHRLGASRTSPPSSLEEPYLGA